jgi:threonine synthase
MDVGDPSNMERLRWLFPDIGDMRVALKAISVSDDEIRETIRTGISRWHQIWCPHTATAMSAWERLDAADRARPWIIVATAHPAKFDTVVEPLIGAKAPLPLTLAELLARPAAARPMDPDLDGFTRELVRLCAEPC